MGEDSLRNAPLLKKGVESFSKGEMSDAINLFDLALKDNPQNFFALIMRGQANIRLEKFCEALSDFSRAVEMAPDMPEPYINRGNLYLQLQDYAGAIEDYKKFQAVVDSNYHDAVAMNLALAEEKIKTPKVFISYSWDCDTHVEWVLSLATRLVHNGVDVLLDKWDIAQFGKPLPNFMERSITDAQRVICIMTPNYKRKTENLVGGVGYEYSIITGEIFSNIGTSKFIPVLKDGGDRESIPTALRGRNYCDMRDQEKFDEKVQELLGDIFNVKKNLKPTIGQKPSFKNHPDSEE